MKKLLVLLLVFSLLLTPGCVSQLPQSGEELPTPTQTPVPTPTVTPDSASAPDLEPEPEYSYPLKEDDVRKMFEEGEYADQNFRAGTITRHVNDFLVELEEIMYPPVSLLYWVFGETGRVVQLTGADIFTSYEIRGPGEVHYTLSGAHSQVPRKGMPQSGTVRVLGDADGVIDENYAQTAGYENAVWLETSEPLYVGSWDTINNEPFRTERKFQLYDARIDADGLSFSFIPNGDSRESFQSFFPASTTCPDVDVSLEDGVFTIRMYNTALESGGVSEEDSTGWLSGETCYPEYPYSFPEGSLGRDSHFLADAEVHQDGSDTVVTCRLTENAAYYQLEQSNVGGDSIPCFRIKFAN